MLVEHRFDARDARAPLQPLDDPAVTDEHEGGDGLDAQSLGEVGTFVDVDARQPHPMPLLACEVRKSAVHPPGRA